MALINAGTEGHIKRDDLPVVKFWHWTLDHENELTLYIPKDKFDRDTDPTRPNHVFERDGPRYKLRAGTEIALRLGIRREEGILDDPDLITLETDKEMDSPVKEVVIVKFTL